MLKTSIKNNVLSLLRDPTTILAVLAAIIMRFIYGFDIYTDSMGNFIDTELYFSEKALDYALNSYVGFATSIVETEIFPFVGIIVAIDLFRDLKTNMADIIFSEQFSFHKYFLSKLISYHILAMLLGLFLTVSYSITYTIVQIPAEANFEWWRVVLAQLVAILVIDTSYLWIPTAWAVFVSALTGIVFTGSIFNCIYRYIPNMIARSGLTFFDHYIHIFPITASLYLINWAKYPIRDIFKFEYSDAYGPESYRMFTSILDLGISYIIQLLIATVLLTASYFLLKRRFQRS